MRKPRIKAFIAVPDEKGVVKTPEGTLVDLAMGEDYISIPLVKTEKELERA